MQGDLKPSNANWQVQDLKHYTNQVSWGSQEKKLKSYKRENTDLINKNQFVQNKIYYEKLVLIWI